MKLTKLILQGFKSFADRTEFEFDAGVNCVVGPNGCGKSNIVDAIKWVLGEQSAKSLRGGEMLDVIFNGSSARKPSGFAGVTLVFENADGLLRPAPNGEVQDTAPIVEITRKLYRSGQSEYLINKLPARLRDIKEMFLDTGIGASAYSVIEQGRISQFLQATQDERRAFFDEAAGISRYKQRKKEALRKLDRVEQNLLRVQDILAEVEKRLRSIKVQAGKARNYQEYSQRLRELRSLHLLSQFHQLKLKRQQQGRNLESATDDLATIQNRIAQLESAQSAAEVESGQLEQSARDIHSRITSLGAQITALQERAGVQAHRAEELSEQILTNSHRGEELEARIEDLAKDTASAEAELHNVRQSGEKLQHQLDAIRSEHAAAELDVQRRVGEIEDEKAGVMDLLRRTSQLHNDVTSLGHKRTSLDEEKNRLNCRADEIAETLKQRLVEHGQQKARRNDAQGVIDESTTRLEQVKADAARLAGQEKQLHEDLSEAREQRSSLIGRTRTLEEMLQRHEGVAEGTRKVLQASREGRLDCIRGMLGDFISTDVQHAAMVEAALAGADQRLVSATFAEVADQSDSLESILGGGGSAEVLCLDRIASLPVDGASVTCPQAVGRVMEYIRFEPWLEPLMWQILGQTLVVRTLADAALAADVTLTGYRFVTLNGEVLEADGRVRFGAMHQTAGVIARRSELADLQVRQKQLDAQIDTLQQQVASTGQQREHNDQLIHSLRTAVYEATFERDEADKRIKQLDEEIERHRQEQPRLAETLQQLEAEIDQAVQAEHDARQQAEALQQQKSQRDQRIAELESQLADARTALQDLGEKWTELKVQRASAEERRVALEDRLAALKRQRESMDAEHASARQAIDADRQRRTEAQAEVEKAQREVGQLRSQQQELQGEADEIAESRKGLTDRLAEIRQQLTERRQAAEDAGQNVSNLRVTLSELDAHVGDLIHRASDEMGMDLTEQCKEYQHDEERDWDAVAEEIRELRGKIDRLGNVNLDAISEQDELEERQTFLGGQIEDIQSSQGQLEELIRKLNKESQERFEATFVAVREHFQGLFRKLFGGGRADILLTDPGDVLESGIDIVARPPGKELRSISLLSGGEKTMAALAMIFAFFKARPSPFCLLDEVDAALDEANNERYNAIVQEFVADTQFIMITHAKRTMSIAGVLYGVTMQEAGVSRRISVRFEEAKELAEQPEPVGAA